MEHRGPTERFAVGRGAPTVSRLVVALHRQEVAVRVALWHEHGGGGTSVAALAAAVGLQRLSPGQLAFGLAQI